MLLRTRRALALATLGLLACAPARAQGPGQRGAADEWRFPDLPPAAPVSAAEHARRRAALAERMRDGVLVVWGQDEPETDYAPFAQNPAFRYLTGITEPGAALVVSKQGSQVRETLFVRRRNPAREVWEGSRLGAERARALTGIATREVEGMMPLLDSLLATPRTLYTVSPLPEDAGERTVLRRDQQLVKQLVDAHAGTRTESLDRVLSQLRGSKSATELDLIRRAVYITILAHHQAARYVEPGMNEFEVQALIEGTFRRYGSERPSFASIVGSGPNSTTLHYREADRFMQAGETLVMDIGASYRGYAADLTRTLPVSGRFSPEQRQVYQIVLDAQKAAEALVRPGATWAQINAAAQRVLAEGLTRLGLIESPTASYACGRNGSSRCPQIQLFYMHGLGHGIGLDVHDPDVSYFGGAFKEGSAFTIEPGIYVRADVLDHLADTPENRALIARLRPVVARYRNIGVRIEDDYVVTARGVERVSEGAPREIAEIEALMAEPSPWSAGRRPEAVEWYRGTTPRPAAP